MKTKKVIGVAVLMAWMASFAYWLGYQHGTTSPRATIHTATNQRELGPAFRYTRNDLGAPFSIMGPLTTSPDLPTSSKD